MLALAGCSTLYRPIYSPGKSNYKKPPEKREAVELLPPTPSDTAPLTAPVPAGGAMPDGAMPGAPAPGGEAPPAIPGLLDAPPAIPGLPQP